MRIRKVSRRKVADGFPPFGVLLWKLLFQQHLPILVQALTLWVLPFLNIWQSRCLNRQIHGILNMIWEIFRQMKTISSFQQPCKLSLIWNLINWWWHQIFPWRVGLVLQALLLSQGLSWLISWQIWSYQMMINLILQPRLKATQTMLPQLSLGILL